MRVVRHTLALLAAAAIWAGAPGVAAQSGAQSGTESARLDLWRPGDPGQRLRIRGRVSDTDGAPVAGAELYIRQADGTGVYRPAYTATLTSSASGSYGFGTVLPGQYSSVKHIHIFVSHPQYASLSTEIRFKGDPNHEGATYDDDAIVVEEAQVNGESLLLGEFNIVLHRQ